MESTVLDIAYLLGVCALVGLVAWGVERL